MDNLKQDEVLELAKEREVFESKVKTVLEKVTGCEKYTYALNSIMIAFDTASAITAKLQEKSQGEAIYQACNRGQWMDISLQSFITHTGIKRIVYLHPASEHPKSVASALEKAIDVCQNWINTSTFYGYTGDADNYKAIQDEIRALIDQPAEQPAQSQELLNRLRERCEIERDGYQAPNAAGKWDLSNPQQSNAAGYQEACNDIIVAIDKELEVLQSKPAKG